MSFELAVNQNSESTQPRTESAEGFETADSTPRKYSSEEIIELAKKVERGEPGALEEMILANKGLVINTATRYARLTDINTDFEDFCQEGFIGLIYAIDRFDWRRGTKFSTYAEPWIKQSILEALRGVSHIKLPQALLNERSHLNRAEGLAMVKSGAKPMVDELSKTTGLPVAKVKTIMNAPAVETSLNQPATESEAHQVSDGTEIGDLIADQKAEDPLEILITSDQTAINGMLRALTERQRMVIELNLGLNGQSNFTQTQIAEKMGISPQRVSQIIDKSRRKIARYLENPQLTKETTKSKQPESRLSWKELAAELSLVEIEVLEMSLEGFSEAEIGSQIDIGFAGTRAVLKDLAKKFDVTAEELITGAPKILQIALAKGGVPAKE